MKQQPAINLDYSSDPSFDGRVFDPSADEGVSSDLGPKMQVDTLTGKLQGLSFGEQIVFDSNNPLSGAEIGIIGYNVRFSKPPIYFPYQVKEARTPTDMHLLGVGEWNGHAFIANPTYHVSKNALEIDLKLSSIQNEAILVRPVVVMRFSIVSSEGLWIERSGGKRKGRSASGIYDPYRIPNKISIPKVGILGFSIQSPFDNLILLLHRCSTASAKDSMRCLSVVIDEWPPVDRRYVSSASEYRIKVELLEKAED